MGVLNDPPEATAKTSSARMEWYDGGKMQQWIKKAYKRTQVFKYVNVFQVLCIIFILVMTFSFAPVGLVDPASGDIIDPNSKDNTAAGVIYTNGDYRPVVAQGRYQKFCLAISRMSAFSMYPVMICVFLTKCKATIGFFSNTPISMYMANDNHELHVYAGSFIAMDTWVHTLFHLLRWADQGNISLLWDHRTGRTGLTAIVVIPLITYPMAHSYMKQKIPYEFRKGLHYLFYVFALGMCFHTPPSGMPNGGFIAYILGFCICLYTLDAIYVMLFMTEKIDTTTFHVLKSGVQMTMAVSEAFHRRGHNGGFAYVCLPWVSHNQWHAFSLFEHPVDPTKRQVFMLKTGDWTTAVHEALQRNTVRPVWVQGPFTSPFNQAIHYDNQILVASGIGITPALSVIHSYKDARRVNLIWAVRDLALLEFILGRNELEHNAWSLIFYTGRKALHPALEKMRTQVCIIKGRPNLHNVIPNIIYGIESRKGLPERYTDKQAEVKDEIMAKKEELKKRLDLTDTQKFVVLAQFVTLRGFLLTELIDDMENECAELGSLWLSTSDFGISAQPLLEGGVGNKDEEQLGSKGIVPEETGDKDDMHLNHRYDENLDLVAGTSLCMNTSAVMGGKNVEMPPCSSVTSRSLANHGLDHNHGAISDSKRRLSDLTEALKVTFHPWERIEGAKEFVRGLDSDKVLSTWGMIYCGGSKPVEKDVKAISEMYKIDMNTESFKW